MGNGKWEKENQKMGKWNGNAQVVSQSHVARLSQGFFISHFPFLISSFLLLEWPLLLSTFYIAHVINYFRPSTTFPSNRKLGREGGYVRTTTTQMCQVVFTLCQDVSENLFSDSAAKIILFECNPCLAHKN